MYIASGNYLKGSGSDRIVDERSTWAEKRDEAYSKMSEDEQHRYDRKRNIITGIFTAVMVVLLIAGLVFYFVTDYRKDKTQLYINEHADVVAVVVDKYTYEYRGTNFRVVAEHSSVTPDGDVVTFTEEYTVPWEDYAAIEVGDHVVGEYTSFTRSGIWQYVSYEKVE